MQGLASILDLDLGRLLPGPKQRGGQESDIDEAKVTCTGTRANGGSAVVRLERNGDTLQAAEWPGKSSDTVIIRKFATP